VYIETAEKFWTLASEFGALSQVECWEADVKDGHTTDFRKAEGPGGREDRLQLGHLARPGNSRGG
jgi:uncharacterized protein YbaA (DUF1428 family)